MYEKHELRLGILEIFAEASSLAARLRDARLYLPVRIGCLAIGGTKGRHEWIIPMVREVISKRQSWTALQLCDTVTPVISPTQDNLISMGMALHDIGWSSHREWAGTGPDKQQYVVWRANAKDHPPSRSVRHDETTVKAIRRLAALGTPVRQIAELVGCSPVQAWRIARGVNRSKVA